MSAAKRKPGRPPLHGEASQPYQVRLPPTVAEKLRKHGAGSLSQGIVKAAGKLRLLLAMDELRSMRAENLSLHERIAALESREVCTVAHDNVEECGYCQRDRLRSTVAELSSADMTVTRMAWEHERFKRALQAISQDEFRAGWEGDEWQDDYWRVVNLARTMLST